MEDFSFLNEVKKVCPTCKQEYIKKEKKQDGLTPIQKIIYVYAKAAQFEEYGRNKLWTKSFYLANCRDAKKLLDYFGNWKDACDCVQDSVEKVRAWREEATPSLSKIFLSHAVEWKKNRLEKVAKYEH